MSTVLLSSTNSRRPLKTIIWDTWDKPPEERRFLHKLDSCLLTYAALSYFSKYLDQQNITNAYVSGMKEDLGLHGNQLNYITTAWTCGYVIGQIPSNLLITRISPSVWIPMMDIVWSALTIALAGAKNFGTLITLRFFIGLAEATFYPGMQFVLGSWYKPTELGKRACLFHVASAIGPMFSGFLQTGAYDGLNGVKGLAGWQWLFIIDGIITIPIGILGFIIMPNLPHNTKPSYIYTEKQLAMACKRMDEIGRRATTGTFTKEKIRSFFTTWHIYTLVPIYVLYNNGSNPSSSMIYWFQSFNTSEKTAYSIGQINTYPLGEYAVQVVTTLIWAWWSDAIQMRWPPMIVAAVWNTAVCIALAATPVYTHIARRWVLYYMTTISAGLSGLILAWANELTGDDSEKRSFVVASCNCLAYTVQAWLPVLIVPQVEQPKVFVGNVATAGITVGLIFFTLLTAYLERRDKLRKARGEDVSDRVEAEVASLRKVDVES